jgi:hypothetical protein
MFFMYGGDKNLEKKKETVLDTSRDCSLRRQKREKKIG